LNHPYFIRTQLLALKPELVRIQVKTREGKHTPLELAAGMAKALVSFYFHSTYRNIFSSHVYSLCHSSDLQTNGFAEHCHGIASPV
jgi:hypothetical protein